jgi:hypothetical protein
MLADFFLHLLGHVTKDTVKMAVLFFWPLVEAGMERGEGAGISVG